MGWHVFTHRLLNRCTGGSHTQLRTGFFITWSAINHRFNASVHGNSWEEGCLLETNSQTLFQLPAHGRTSASLEVYKCLLPPPPLSLGNHCHRFQNPIITKWLLPLFHQLRPKSDISTGSCKENCPCGKTCKTPHCSARPCDSASLPVGRINLGVRIFSLPQLCCLIGSKLWKMSQYSGKVSRTVWGPMQKPPTRVRNRCLKEKKRIIKMAPAAAVTLAPLWLRHCTTQIVLYEGKCFTGRKLEIRGDCDNFQDRGFMSRVNSVRVESGAFICYDHPDFKGQQYILEHGEYPEYQSWNAHNDHMGSCRPIRMVRQFACVCERPQGQTNIWLLKCVCVLV